MTYKIKRYLTILFSVIAISCFILASLSIFVVQDNFNIVKADSDSSSDYALVLTEYKLESTSGLEKIYDPNGEEVSFNEGKFLLKIVGEYQLVYNGNVKTIQVLRRNPNVVFSYDKDINGLVYETGDILTLPKAHIESILGVYENYNVTLSREGQDVKTVHSSAIEDFSYVLMDGGNYSLTYTCTDSTSLKYTCSNVVNFAVKDNKAIFIKELPAEINYGESIDVGAVYGVYMGKTYPANVVINKPSGDTEVFNDIFYMPTEPGDYKFIATTDIDGEKIVKEQSVKVTIAASSLLTNFYSIEKMTAEVDLPSYSKVQGKSLYVEAQNNKAYVYYSKIIDLRKMTKDDAIINFLPYSDGSSGSRDEIKISLIDVHDTSNYLTVYWWYNKNVSTVSYTSVYLSGEEYGGMDNEKSTSTGELRKNYGAISWGCYFNSYNQGLKSRLFNIRYDYDENAIYSLTNNRYSSTDKLTKFIDMDDPELLGYSKVWDGFTTGEVYLKIEFSSSQSTSAIFIESICGEKLDYSKLENATNDSCFIVNSQEEILPDGVVGYYYNLPSYTVNENLNNIVVTQKIYKGEEVVGVNLEVFKSTLVGKYKVVYSAIDNYGSLIEKTYNFTILQESKPINITLPESNDVDLYSYYTIPEIEVSGGSGTLKVKKELYCNGELITTDTGAYLIDKVANYVVKISVTDFNGCVGIDEYSLDVNYDYVSLILSREINAVRAGCKIEFPSFETFDFLTSSSLDKMLEVIINGQVVKAFTGDVAYLFNVPNDASTITLKYYAGKGTEREKVVEREVSVIKETINSMTDFIIYDSEKVSATMMREGAMFTFKQDASIKMPYALPVDGLKLGFGIDASSINFDNLIIRFTDAVDNGIVVDFKFYSIVSGGSAKLEVNNDGRMFSANYNVNQFYSYSEEDALRYDFAGKDYYYYECYYDGALSKLCYANGTELASVLTSKNGLNFAGFSSGLVFVEILAEGVTLDSNIILYTASNQNFSTTIESLGYEDHDTAGPNLLFDSKMVATSRHVLNSKIIVSMATAYDLLQQTSTDVKVKILDPQNNVIFNNVIVDSFELLLDKYGIYTITYSSYDAVYNISNQIFTVTVIDNEAPVLDVESSVKAEYKVGNSITIPKATVDDESKIMVYVKTPDAKYFSLSQGDKYKFESKGIYYLVYSAQDAYGNMARTVYTIKVS